MIGTIEKEAKREIKEVIGKRTETKEIRTERQKREEITGIKEIEARTETEIEINKEQDKKDIDKVLICLCRL